MDKFKVIQLLKLLFMAILLCITPLLSTPFRPPYIYFVVNLLIIALGAEAGLLSFIAKTTEEKKTSSPGNVSTDINNAVLVSSESSVCNTEKSAAAGAAKLESAAESNTTAAKKKPKVVEKSVSEKVVAVSSIRVHKVAVRKSPSMPSLFFIAAGSGENNTEDQDQDDEMMERQEDSYDDKQEAAADHEISGQELFHKAETFIGNFYNQLKMQREDSWKKIHGLYHKAF